MAAPSSAADVHEQPGPTISGTNGQQASVAALHARSRRAEIIVAQQALLLDSVCELLAAGDLQRAMDALADSLKLRFECSRVAISLKRGKRLELVSISQQAAIASSSAEVTLLLAAMYEACDQESIVRWPSSEPWTGIVFAHRALASKASRCQICTLPLFAHNELVGSILLEREKDAEFPVQVLERLAVCISPLIALQVRAGATMFEVMCDRVVGVMKHYLGSDRPGLRFSSILACLALLAATAIPVNWQIVAPAELLPSERRHVNSPENGFIRENFAEAGDKVTEGDVLAMLDQREIELEVAAIDSEIALAQAEFRAAMASYDKQAIGLARARLAQQRARRNRIASRLERLRLLAPMSGVIVSANASRTSGTAVSRGETLFEIAPDESFEVHLFIAESDIRYLSQGQAGVLSLHSQPGQLRNVIVDTVHPVAEAGEGQTRFRARATLTEPVSLLRAGQSGLVRIDAGRTNIYGKLTRRLNRRLAQFWWRYFG